ncbi:MAG: M24 family metallopeptidase [Anaerolineaceae bacterium]|nr:M24 family metallopeptidase [Anaerolineaceae bacterium]
MNRLQEIEFKHNQVRALLDRYQSDGLWLRRTRNIAWITAGGDSSIPVEYESGIYSVLITREKRAIYTSNIELTRLQGEEPFAELGFEYAESPWHSRKFPDMPGLLTDDGEVEAELNRLRRKLTAGEQVRYRALGVDAAAALDEAIRAVQPGDTEFEMAARLDAACKRRGGLATVNLVGTDERISRYRHPLATNKRLQKYAMIVVCMRRGGLIAAATRLAHFGPLSGELTEKMHKIAAIDAAVIAASTPGRSLGDVFADLQAAYAAQGETEQWRLHHQGGLIGYLGREVTVTPGDKTPLENGHACAWNPSIVGCKSEDTILVTDSGTEILTAAPEGWPVLPVTVNGQVIHRPAILEL